MLGAQLPLLAALPFVALLLAIALLPLGAPQWWHQNRNKALVAAVASLPILVYFWFDLGEPGRQVLHEKFHEYLSFIVVIGALFVITGGIHKQRADRSEEHTSELQSLAYLVCRLLLEKKKNHKTYSVH